MCKLHLKNAYFSVSLEKIQGNLFASWFGTGTTNIHKIVKSANENLTQDKHRNYNLLRRHVIYWSLFRKDAHDSRNSNFPFATSRICHKMGKVCVDTSAGNRVFEPDNQLYHSVTFFKKLKKL